MTIFFSKRNFQLLINLNYFTYQIVTEYHFLFVATVLLTIKQFKINTQQY